MSKIVRLRNDRRDITPHERMLIRAGQYVYSLYRNAALGKTGNVSEQRPYLEACETIWAAKRVYRAEQVKTRKSQSEATSVRFAKIRGK